MELSAASRAAFYHELHRYVQAGLDLPRAIDSFLTERSDPRLRAAMRRIHERFTNGQSVEAAFNDPALSKVEQSMIGAAELSGRLEPAMAYLANYFQAIAQTQREIRGNLVYPVFLLHFAAIILPISKLFQGGVGPYLVQVIAVLGAAYGVAITLGFTCWLLARFSEVDPTVDAVVFGVPLFGSTRRKLALARLFASVEMLVNAGVGLGDAFARASATTKSASLQTSIQRAVKEIERGQPVDQALRASGSFPEQVLRGIRVGLETGTLDVEMGRWAKIYWQNASDGVRALAKWVPRLLYLIIVLVIAYQIIQTAQGILDTYDKVLEM